MKMQRLAFLVGMALFFGAGDFSPSAFGFPEMVRHGYPNCITCHVSPDGGGTLTKYGRSLSAEILSTWAYKDETKYLYFVSPPDWLDLGGDARWLQTYKNTPKERSGRFIFMQADAEAAATVGKFTVDATLGKQFFADDDPHPAIQYLTSRRHYLLYHATDQWNVRAGRFPMAYGIHTPDHFISTKRDLGWDEGSETYNLEGSWIGDNADFFMTVNLGRLDFLGVNDPTSPTSERGFALRGSYTLSSTYKMGASYFFGTTPQIANRHVYGPYLILGFTPHFFLLSEADLQNYLPKLANGSQSTFGFVTYNRLDYEWFQGFHTFVTGEVSRLDFSRPESLGNAFGGGIQFFPRPHFEMQLVYQRKRLGDQMDFYDYAYFMFHFYP